MRAAPPITFAGAPLDRAPAQRRRPEWLVERARADDARAVLASERGVWVEHDERGVRLALARPATLPSEPLLLGLADGRPLFAFDPDTADVDGLPGAP